MISKRHQCVNVTGHPECFPPLQQELQQKVVMTSREYRTKDVTEQTCLLSLRGFAWTQVDASKAQTFQAEAWSRADAAAHEVGGAQGKRKAYFMSA